MPLIRQAPGPGEFGGSQGAAGTLLRNGRGRFAAENRPPPESGYRWRSGLSSLARDRVHDPVVTQAKASSPASLVRCSMRPDFGSYGVARCMVPVLSQITRSPIDHLWR